MYYSANSSNSQ